MYVYIYIYISNYNCRPTRHNETWIGRGSKLRVLFLTSVLKEGKWSVLGPCRSNLEKTAPSTHYTGGWVSPSARIQALEKK